MAPDRRHALSWAVLAPFAVLLACAACDRRERRLPDDGAAPPAEARHELDIFAFGRVLGTIAPCGCTTEPLGGLQYTFGFLESESAAGARLVLEPGSFLFPDPAGPEAPTDEAAWDQARKRAELLQARFSGLGEGLVSGLGPTDLSSPDGLAAVERFSLPRVLANGGKENTTAVDQARPPIATVLPHRIVRLQAGKLAIFAGVTAVIDPSTIGADRLGALAEPKQALAREVESMRSAGANLILVQAHGDRTFAETLAREIGGIDMIVVGIVEGTDRKRLGSPPTRIGTAWIVEPAEQLQSLTHVRLLAKPAVLELPPAASWEVVPARSVRDQELARIEERLAKFAADPGADQAFLARLEAERDQLKKTLDGPLDSDADVVAIFEQVKVTCRRPVDDQAKRQLHDYDAWVAEKNRTRFAESRPPAPRHGQSGYAGVEECDLCHSEVVAAWNDTLHAGAYDTLVQANKQYDLSCVGCHVTGFMQPGGSHVVLNEGLRAVQCEVCHGPGELHVQKPEKNGRPHAIRRDAPVTVCTSCHTPEHSDTFDYTAYLRDVLGPGHAPAARQALGEGPTGRELRAAGLAKAGGSCK